MRTSLHPALSRAVNQRRQAVELVARQPGGRFVEEGRDRLLRGAVEKGLQDMAQRRTLGVVARHCWEIDVTGPVLFVLDVSLLFQNTQERANGRIAGRFGQVRLHLGGGCPPLLIEDVENLPLAAAQIAMRCGGHKGPSPWSQRLRRSQDRKGAMKIAPG